MMEESSLATDESYDSYDEQDDRPLERWAPLGAASVTPPPSAHGDGQVRGEEEENERLSRLEEEQEQLNSSLLALTTHFAQVQFRLKQIVSASPDQKEDLLKELEEFAFKGIPDVREIQSCATMLPPHMNSDQYEAKIAEQRLKQHELIEQLKGQLEDLETYAYQTGDAELPSSVVLQKQDVIIDQLKQKLDLNLEHFDQLGAEELRQVVDRAIGEIVNPAKVKEKLVDQLKTQITDLERFIDFLQGEAVSPGPLKNKWPCPVHKNKPGEPLQRCTPQCGGYQWPVTGAADPAPAQKSSPRASAFELMRQALTVLQIYTISQLSCGSRDFRKNVLKRTTKGNHWGDLRARLEIAVDKVSELSKLDEVPQDSDYLSDCDEPGAVSCPPVLTTAVRKDLAVALADLLQHGLMQVGQSSSVVPFGCFPTRAKTPAKMMHAWDLFLKFYEMKHGKEYNATPARKLSQSFQLDIIGGKAVSNKQTLLGAIEEVLSSHTPLKRSEESQFKAFVCLALNQNKLVHWLQLLLRTRTLVEFYYQPWSYVIKTGFDDALICLDRLNKVAFNLPVDLAIKPFQNIKDAF